jgi:glycosyltransferase involved in cell wall biosynthesis
MSAGLPVIVSDWNGYRETVKHGATGFLVKTTFFDNHEVWDCAESFADFRYQHLTHI